MFTPYAFFNQTSEHSAFATSLFSTIVLTGFFLNAQSAQLFLPHPPLSSSSSLPSFFSKIQNWTQLCAWKRMDETCENARNGNILEDSTINLLFYFVEVDILWSVDMISFIESSWKCWEFINCFVSVTQIFKQFWFYAISTTKKTAASDCCACSHIEQRNRMP